MNTVLKILAFFRMVDLVWLEDYESVVYLSIKRKHPFRGYYAHVLPFGIGEVVLNDDGTCSGKTTYIKRWKDY